MSTELAIVGMACRFPDAATPQALWETVLARRRAFRRLPPERLRLSDYHSADPEAVDQTCAVRAAVLEGYAFDRARFQVAGRTFRATDLAQWLALEVADAALADAGLPAAAGAPRESTAVVIGNTLTGEFSRAAALRLRWPYVQRVVRQALGGRRWTQDQADDLLAELEQAYKAPFPAPSADTLAGGLSNTIAGRICNHFGFQGGGYTVDGACAASLLAVINACTLLIQHEADVVVAGGVDLSLDPFELVGFARAGALAMGEMRVYDAHPTGFLPGEGCGLFVLMRRADAAARGLRIRGVIRGWGISSDGHGGMTRPEVSGQVLALSRAYRRAGIDIGAVPLFEGHGTGTAVGDDTELAALAQARGGGSASPAAIGSIKANIGHTKAAAGAAALIKTVLALEHRVLPPITGCMTPHPRLSAPGAALRVLSAPEEWPAQAALYAGVSAMGFGGINTHVVVAAEGADAETARRAGSAGIMRTVASSAPAAPTTGVPSAAAPATRVPSAAAPATAVPSAAAPATAVPTITTLTTATPTDAAPTAAAPANKGAAASSAGALSAEKLPALASAAREPEMLPAGTTAAREPEKLPAGASAAREPEMLPAGTSAAREPEKLPAGTSAAREPEKLPAVASAAREPEMLRARTSAAREPEKLPAGTSAAREPEKLPAVASAAREPEMLRAGTSAAREPEKLPAGTSAAREPEMLPAGTSAAREPEKLPAVASAAREPEEEPRAPRQPGAAPARSTGSAAVTRTDSMNATPSAAGPARTQRIPREMRRRIRVLGRSGQDAEVFLFSAPDVPALRALIDSLHTRASGMACCELADAAAALVRERHHPQARAAVVAATPDELAARLHRLSAQLKQGGPLTLDPPGGVFHGQGRAAPRIGLLFTGQGNSPLPGGGILAERFTAARAMHRRTGGAGPGATDPAALQPAIVAASLGASRILEQLGVEACVAVGHSLGEISALAWGGALDPATALRLAAARGAAAERLSGPAGGMAALAAPAQRIAPWLRGTTAVIAGFNGAGQTTISGERDAVACVLERAAAAGVRGTWLGVRQAFHSPLMAPAAAALAPLLAELQWPALRRRVVSTVTGSELPPRFDAVAHFTRQWTAPVRFAEALTAAAPGLDLWIETGPAAVLAQLAAGNGDVPAISMEAGGQSIAGLLRAVAAAFALGAEVRHPLLFARRFTRPFDWQRAPRFLTNPCEALPAPAQPDALPPPSHCASPAPGGQQTRPGHDGSSPEKRRTVYRGVGVVQRQLLHNGHHARDAAGTSATNGAGAPQRFGAAAVTDADGPLASLRHASAAPSHNPVQHAPSGAAAPAASGAEGGPQHRGPGEAPHFEGPAAAVGYERALEALRHVIAEHTELPATAVEPGSRMLADLHLNSILVAQIVAQTARSLGLAPPAPGTTFATASAADIARALCTAPQAPAGPAAEPADSAACACFPPGIEPWIRAFVVERRDAPALPEATARRGASGAADWRVLAQPGDATAARLRAFLDRLDDRGVVVCLPPQADAGCIALLLDAARTVMALPRPARFVLVQHAAVGAAGLARTLRLEQPDIDVCVVSAPLSDPRAPGWVIAEAAACSGYCEAHYDAGGRRTVPELRPWPQPQETDWSLGPGDVLLVTGGGKGIAAECCRAAARESGARLALLGRSRPEHDAGLAGMLAQLAAGGVMHRYECADVADPVAVRAAVTRIQDTLGPVTALWHAAGINEPRLLDTLDEAAFRRTLAPKVDGARHVLAALEPRMLRQLVGFGSSIARTGLPGEADYAVANEWLGLLIDEWAQAHPHCRCLTVEWSVWSGAGMGQRLGGVESLRRQGVTPIPASEGVRWLKRLLGSAPAGALRGRSVLVAGRLGAPETLPPPSADLWRFCERMRVHVAGVEVVADAGVSVDTDRYLADHVLEGQPLLPAVVGLEAMAQSAAVLAGAASRSYHFANVRFDHPVVIPADGPLELRVMALAGPDGEVAAALRSSATGHAMNHFSAVIGSSAARIAAAAQDAEATLHIDPATHLYGELLFHGPRFRRLAGYRRLSATECIADIAPAPAERWFGPYLPGRLALGDPGVRDAAIHAIQACIPHARLLPVAADEIIAGALDSTQRHRVHARERQREGTLFTYDLDIAGEGGTIVERWRGLRLRVAGPCGPRAAWHEALLGAHVERRAAELLDVRLRAALAAGPGPRAVRGSMALTRAADGPLKLMHDRGGRPLCSAGAVSLAHSADLTLAVVADHDIGCDFEAVQPRSAQVWMDLLGPAGRALAERLAAACAESLDAAGTRVWSAREALFKAGAPAAAPLNMDHAAGGGWALLTGAGRRIATWCGGVLGAPAPMVLAVAAAPPPQSAGSAAPGAAAGADVSPLGAAPAMP